MRMFLSLPDLVVLGPSITFIIMGAISSLFGAFLAGRTRSIELTGAVIILLMCIVVLFDLGIFKRLSRLSNIQVKGEGRFASLLIGMALGLLWVPCIGPFLSSILTMVGTSGEMANGIILLGFYSLGLAIPMLIVAYSSHLLQRKLSALSRHDALFRYVTGSILIAFS